MGINCNRHNHHCPGASGRVDGFPGNCRNTRTHCRTHQWYCSIHDIPFMKSRQNCMACLKDQQAKDRIENRNSDNRADEDPDESMNGKKKTPKKNAKKGGNYKTKTTKAVKKESRSSTSSESGKGSPRKG